MGSEGDQIDATAPAPVVAMPTTQISSANSLQTKVKKLVDAKAEAEEIAAATMQRDEFEAKCPAVSTKFYQLRALTTQDWAVPLPVEGEEA